MIKQHKKMTHTKTKKEIAENLKKWAEAINKVADKIENAPLPESIGILNFAISGIEINSFVLQDIHEQEIKQHNG